MKKKIHFPAWVWYAISFGSGMFLLGILALLLLSKGYNGPVEHTFGLLGVMFAIVWGFSTILHYLKSKDE